MDHALQMAQFREAAARDPGDPANWRGLCRAAEALRVWAEVTKALERLVALAEDRTQMARLRAKLGGVREGCGDLPGARSEYERALQAEPTWGWPYLALAMLDLRERRWSRAIAHANHALEFVHQDSADRPWLLLVKAIAGQRVSNSMGPQSTFFRTLRGPMATTAPDPGRAAFEEARGHLPALVGQSAESFLEDGAAATQFVVERCPRPVLDV